MSKVYNVEIKFGTKWQLTAVKTRYTDALHHVKENSGERYPMRIVRVVRTIMFEGSK